MQRTIADGHDLSSPRFKGDEDLEACYDDEARLTTGGRGQAGTRKIESGPAVQKVQDALVELKYLNSDSATGSYNDATWEAVKQLKKDKHLGWEEMGDVGPGTIAWLDRQFPAKEPKCPPCDSAQPRDPECAACNVPSCPPCDSKQTRGAECPPCETPKKVCGPNIDRQLTAVLTEMQTYFRGLGGVKKHISCQWLITPPMAIMAWDINELFLPNTGWLRRPPWQPPCGLPAAPSTDIEDPTTCGNSVQVGGKCNLAGTANYLTWGVLAKECYDYYSGSPSLPTWSVNAPLFSETGMQAFISMYKLGGLTDDTGPPKAFAVASYRGGPSGRPTTENRKDCSTTCAAPGSPPTFTFVWEPYHARP